MKKTIAFILAICLLFICMNGCSSKNVIVDLSQTNFIKIRVVSSTDHTYTDYVISDKEIVQSICDTFSSLELKKVKITEPLSALYSVGFYETNTTKKAIASFTLVLGNNVIDDGENLYKIESDINIHDYVANIVANLPHD